MNPQTADKFRKNNDELVGMADQLINEDLLKIFGNDEIDLPSGVRGRVKDKVEECLGSRTPLARQAAIAIKKGQFDIASRLLDECLNCNDKAKNDPRFFGVFWLKGKLELERGNGHGEANALPHFQEAITKYNRARESHYVEVAELLLKSDRTDKVTLADAIVEKGLEKCPNGQQLLNLSSRLTVMLRGRPTQPARARYRGRNPL